MTFTPTPQQRAEWREQNTDREADQARAEANNRRIAMKYRKTALGDRVQKFPSVDPLRESAGEAYKAIVAAYEEAEKAKAVQERINATSPADTKRFPGLGGGA